jgi:hypothetical protein
LLGTGAGALFADESLGVGLGGCVAATGAGGMTFEGTDCGLEELGIAFVPRHDM